MANLRGWMSRSETIGAGWRRSTAYITFVVGLGIGTDNLIYSLPVAVVPFQLAKLGYADLSSLTGWLLFASAGGIVVSTPGIAYISEKYHMRRAPLLFGVILQIGSVIMFMLAPNYAVMALARALQGISSTSIWTAGIALLCDSVSPAIVGSQMFIVILHIDIEYSTGQLGLSLIGLSLGAVAGPPLGGVLYQKFGFYAPFILGVALATLDLVARCLVIEPVTNQLPEEGRPISPIAGGTKALEMIVNEEDTHPVAMQPGEQEASRAQELSAEEKKAFMWPIRQMLSSPVALTACFNTFTYGLILPTLNPTLPLRLWDVFGYDSQSVGLIYIAIIVPTCFSGILSGWLSDRKGTKWITLLFQIVPIPWFGLMIVRYPLVLLIISVAIACFFVSGILSPVMADLFGVASSIDGLGFAHVFGIFNMSYSIAAAIGPIIGGQMYDRLSDGWLAVCVFCAASMVASMPPTFFFAGKHKSLPQDNVVDPEVSG